MLIDSKNRVGKNRVTREDPLRNKGLKKLGNKPCEYVGECVPNREQQMHRPSCLRNSKESREHSKGNSNRFSL